MNEKIDMLQRLKGIPIGKLTLRMQFFSSLSWAITYWFFRKISTPFLFIAFFLNIACFISSIVFAIHECNRTNLKTVGKSILLIFLFCIFFVIVGMGGIAGLG